MSGGKAVALEAWAKGEGRAMLRLDYAGCGESNGNAREETLASWRDGVLQMIDALTEGPLLLVGSSMGGWLMLLVALARPERVAGLVGIAAAPDFTDWGYDQAQKAVIQNEGLLLLPNIYGAEPTPVTRGFWDSGQTNLLLGTTIAIDAPVRLLHGQCDPDVPWEKSIRLAAALRSDDVQVTLIKDGDHRLSRDQDICLLERTVASLLEA
jgi:pimeloyl-ACP methyl ester carboxylesterase